VAEGRIDPIPLMAWQVLNPLLGQKLLLPILDGGSVSVVPVPGFPNLELVSAVLFRDAFGSAVFTELLDWRGLKFVAVISLL